MLYSFGVGQRFPEPGVLLSGQDVILLRMLMIIAKSADTTGSVGPAIVLAVLGIAGVCFGARWAFNLRGAADKTLQRRRAVLALKAQQRGNLAWSDSDAVGPKFFRVMGAIVLVGSAVICLSSVAVAFP